MAEWEYKEDTWFTPIAPNIGILTKKSNREIRFAFLNREFGIPQGFYVGKDGYPKFRRFELDGTEWEDNFVERVARMRVVPLKEAERQIDEWESTEIPDFTTWLGLHSKEGWEIFKISREFRNTNKNTWCVFRRKI